MSHGKLKTFYNSDAWLAFRQKIILERGTVCQECGKQMFGKMQLHHTPVELTEENYLDISVSLNPDNVKLICLDCHNKAHGRYCGGGRRRKDRTIYLVYGPPLSGKTAYVQSMMEYGDMVVDLDLLYQAISGQQSHENPDTLKYNLFAIKNELIGQITRRYGYFNSAFVVGGYPNVAVRNRLIKELGAEEIFMDVSKEECIRRLEACTDYRGKHKAEWMRYIEEWFEEYSK